MTTHRANVERSLLPRGLIARQSFRFAIGQHVTFYGCHGIIENRSLSAMSVELYQIFIQGDERPCRTVRGDYLEPSPAPVAAALDWKVAA